MMHGLLLFVVVFMGISTFEVPTQETPDVVIATFDGGTITRSEFEKWCSLSNWEPDSDRELVIQQLAISKSMAAEAIRRGWDADPVIQVELDWKTNQLVQATLKKDVFSKIVVPVQKIEAMYQNSRDRQNKPRKLRLYNIYKRIPDELDVPRKKEVRQEIDRLRLRLLAGEDFTAIAEAESDSQTRFRKGLIGNVPAGVLTPEVDKVAMTMKAGEISEVIETKDGLTILYCEKIIPEVKRTEIEFKEKISKYLKRQLQERAWLDIENELLTRAAIQYDLPILRMNDVDGSSVIAHSRGKRMSVSQLKALASLPNPSLSYSDTNLERRKETVSQYFLLWETFAEAERRGLLTAEITFQRAITRQKELEQKLRLHLIKEKFKPPSDEELVAYFEANHNKFVQQEQFDLSMIQWSFSPEELKDSYLQGEKVRASISSGELDFEAAAERYSELDSSKSGGRLGWIGRSQIGASSMILLKAILRMKPGQLSGLIQHEQKLWILKLHGHHDKRPMTYLEAKSQLEDIVGTDKAQVLEVKIINEWLDKIDIQMAALPVVESPE